MRKRSLLALVLTTTLVVSAACSDSAAPPTTTADPGTPRTTITIPRPGGETSAASSPDAPSSDPPSSDAPTTASPPAGAWRVDTAACPDPTAATAPIAGTLTVAMAAPLTGGVAAAQWKPVVDGMRTAIDHANFTHALGDVRLELKVVDDRLDPDRTEDVLQAAIDDGADVVAGVVGTDTNLGVRFTLNEQCIPQLFALSPTPALGDVAEYPWTMGFAPSVVDELGVASTLVTATASPGGTLGVYAAAGTLGDDYVAAAGDLATSNGLQVVATERVDPTSSLPATDSIGALVAARPDVIVAAPDGLDCTWFLRGLGAQRAAVPDWRPLVVLAAGCALPAVLRLAGPLADGVVSVSAFADPAAGADPAVPDLADYVTWMQGAGLGDETAAAVPGWSAGQSLVAVLRAAQTSDDGLSRASILDAARHLDSAAPLGRPGVVLRTDGSADPDVIQSGQVVRWNATAGRFDAVGPVVTDRET